MVDYFKAAAAGSDVGRRLLLLLGPPSGGKSTLAILLKRGLEEYSRTDEGALYAIKGSPLRESPLNLIPTSLRAEFRETLRRRHPGRALALGPRLSSSASARAISCACRSSASSSPRPRAAASALTRRTTPPTADIADLVGSVDLSKVAQVGDEGDPRAWSWSGAVYAASRGVLEMIEILKVKREFLYLLLTLTQEKNVKVSRFPLIYLDETILAHTNLAEFHQLPAGEGERGAARPHGHHQGALCAVLQGRGAHLQEAGVRRAGLPQRPSGSARAAPGGGVRHPHAAQPSPSARASTWRRRCDYSPARRSRGSPRPKRPGCAPRPRMRACPASARAS